MLKEGKMIQPDPREDHPSQNNDACANKNAASVVPAENKESIPTIAAASFSSADVVASVLSLVLMTSNPTSAADDANVASVGVATSKTVDVQAEETTGQRENDDDELLKIPQQAGPKKPKTAAIPVDEAVLIQRRAMNTIHSRRKRVRLRIEIEVLREQCTEFKSKNMAIRDENNQLELMIQSIQAQILQRETSIAAISSSSLVALPPQQQLAQFPIRNLQSVYDQQQYPSMESVTPWQQPFHERHHQQQQLHITMNTNTGLPFTSQDRRGSNNTHTIQNEPQRTVYLRALIQQQMNLYQQQQPLALQQQQQQRLNTTSMNAAAAAVIEMIRQRQYYHTVASTTVSRQQNSFPQRRPSQSVSFSPQQQLAHQLTVQQQPNSAHNDNNGYDYLSIPDHHGNYNNSIHPPPPPPPSHPE